MSDRCREHQARCCQTCDNLVDTSSTPDARAITMHSDAITPGTPDDRDVLEHLGRLVIGVSEGDGFTTEIHGTKIAKCDECGTTEGERLIVARAEAAEAELDRLRAGIAALAEGAERWMNARTPAHDPAERDRHRGLVAALRALARSFKGGDDE